MKSLTTSKVFWLAVVQAIVGALVILFTNIPDLVGYVAIVKSIGDIILRIITTETIERIT